MDNIEKMKIKTLAPNELGLYMEYIPREDIRRIRSGGAYAIGINADGGKPVGAMIFGHAYSIHGVVTKEVEIGGRRIRQNFVEILNPWHNNVVRHYDKDTMKPFAKKDDRKEDGTRYEAQGTFLMELRDFCESFGRYGIEEL